MDPHHHHHHPHHREEEERRRREEELRHHHFATPPHRRPSPPPPPPPPPPPHHHPSPPPPQPPHRHPSPPTPPHHHGAPPPHLHHHTAPPPPPPDILHHSLAPTVQHVAHHVLHLHDPPPRPLPQYQRTVRIFPKAGEGYSLSIREGQVVLAKAHHLDPYQHWIKDERYSTKVKDEEGHPSFALVNKATGEAIKHSFGETEPVRLVRYNPDYLDLSVLWTESKDVGGGFCGIRMVNNIKLNFDAFHGDKGHEGVHDGTIVVLWEWWKGDNELWKIVPYCEFQCFPSNL